MLPVARKNVANANGSKSENWPRHVSVTSKLNTRTHTNLLELELEGYPRILPLVLSLGPSHHIREEDSSQGKGLVPLTRLQGFSLVNDQYLLTMEVASSPATAPYPHIKEEVSSQASVPCPHSMEEVSSLAKGPSPHTTEVEHFLVSGVRFHLITAVELYRAPNPSPLTSVVVVSRGLLTRLLPTTRTRFMGLPTMRSRGEWAI